MGYSDRAESESVPAASSLADFQRIDTRQVSTLVRSGRPHVLTVNGKPRLIVQDARAYQRLLNAIERAEAIASVKRSMIEFERGQGRPAASTLRQAMSRRASGGAKTGRKGNSDRAA